MSETNWSIYALAGAVVLAYAPHALYVVKIQSATGFRASNQAPRGNLDKHKNKLSASTVRILERARAAHENGVEGFPIFAAAMLAGNMAKLPVADLNRTALHYLVARVLFNAVYLGAWSEVTSYPRTIVWGYGMYLCVKMLMKAGEAMF